MKVSVLRIFSEREIESFCAFDAVCVEMFQPSSELGIVDIQWT